jgi:hypothetical protein
MKISKFGHAEAAFARVTTSYGSVNHASFSEPVSTHNLNSQAR